MLAKHIREKAADLDKTISYQVYRFGQKLPISEQYFHALEWSCNGVIWLLMVTTLIFTSSDNDFWINLLIGLLLDIIYIASAKAFCRRRRPFYAPQHKHTWLTVDKLSFPSGHASRSIYVALVFSDGGVFGLLIWLWAISVTLSRVLYGRHFIGDVLAGVLVGYFNYITQFTLLYPLHSFVKWFLVNVVLETINETY